MKHILYSILLLIFITGCTDIHMDDPYNDNLNTLQVQAVYPDDYTDYLREGVNIHIENIDLGYSYTANTDKLGKVEFSLTNGVYRISLNDKVDENIFNGTADRVIVAGQDVNLTLPLVYSKAGNIIFKEIYCGGCTKTPQEGSYQMDQYFILHNNGGSTVYLDSLCFGTLDPSNSNATNIWVTSDPLTGETIFPEFLPIYQAIWQFGGDGTTFPLEPGEDAVVAIGGAINHAAQFPESINLNKENYFVCYNNVHFTSSSYHPVPGDQIKQERYLDVVVKVGKASAYTISTTSPTAIIFKAEGITIQDFILEDENVIQKPGSATDRIVKIPSEWVIDAVEVFNGKSSSNTKRLSPALDAGYVVQTDSNLGRTLHRKVDEEATLQNGYEVLIDTNNSSNDFYEREQQSLHE